MEGARWDPMEGTRRSRSVGGGLCSAAPLSNGSCRKVRRLFVIAEFGGGDTCRSSCCVRVRSLRSRSRLTTSDGRASSCDDASGALQIGALQGHGSRMVEFGRRQPWRRCVLVLGPAELGSGLRFGASQGAALRGRAMAAGSGEDVGSDACMQCVHVPARTSPRAVPPRHSLCGPWCVPSLVVRCVLGALVR